MKIVGNLTTESLLIALSGFVIVFLMLSLLALMIVVISKAVGWLSGRASTSLPAGVVVSAAAQAAPVAVPRAATAIASSAQTAPYGGAVTLQNVDELTAACIMAIVSDETGTAPEQLVFKSIKAI